MLWRRRRVRTGSGFNWGAFFMPTKLFNVVNVYDTPALTDINPVAAEDVQIDLAAIGGNVNVNFPATGIEGQAIGVCLLSESAGFAAGYVGPVDVLVSSSLQRAGDCELFTWDAGASLWRLVAAYRVPAAATVQWLTPTGTTTPVSGDGVVDVGSSTITLPEAPADGTFIGVKSQNGNTTLQAQGGDAIDAGDGTSGSSVPLPYVGAAAIYMYSGGIYQLVAGFERATQLKPEQDTLTARTLSLGDIGLLLEFTDGGLVTVTVPPQGAGVGEVPWPSWASFDFVAQGGNLTVLGGTGVAVNVLAGKDPTSAGAYARLRLERMTNTDEWLLSGDLADTGP